MSVSGYLTGADATNRNIRNSVKATQGVKANLQGQTADLMGEAMGAYSPYTQNAAGDMDAYRQSVLADTSKFAYDPADPFAYDLQAQAQAFLDPTLDAQIKAATGAVEGSAANAGKLFSGATGQNIADKAVELKGQGLKDALQMAMQDRGFQYGVSQDAVANSRAAKDQAAQLAAQKQTGLGNLAGIGQQAVMGLANTNLGLKGDMYKGMNDADLAIANLMAQRAETGFAPIIRGAIKAAPGIAAGAGGLMTGYGDMMAGGKMPLPKAGG